MFNRKKKNQTPGAQATRAQTNIFVRVVGCGFLIYTIMQLIRSEEFNSGEFWPIVLVAFLGLSGLLIIVLTIIELIRNIKRGAYSAKFYGTEETSEELPEELPEAVQEEIPEETPEENEDFEEPTVGE